jgi:parallel beta-helix repeat protein
VLFRSTVFVFQGSYYGKVVINKSISVLGEDTNRTFINYTYEPDWDSYVVMIRSHDVVFSGFTAVLEQGDGVLLRLKDSRNCTISHNVFWATFGTYLLNSSYASIENNSFFTIAKGIYTNSSNGIIKNNWFTNKGKPGNLENCGVKLEVSANENVISGNYFYHCIHYAILSYSPYRNIIERNVIRVNNSYDEGIAVYLEYSEHFPPGNIVRENDIAGCDNGIGLSGDYFTVENNFIHDNDNGMVFSTFSCYHVTVNNNTFMNDFNGLVMDYGKDGSTIERNIFQGCGRWGLSLYQCSGLTIQFNNFTSNTCAVEPFQSNSNTFSQNNFIGNHHYIFSFLSRNSWQGNYWDAPRSLPKLILGILPFIQFDWHPAQQPN